MLKYGLTPGLTVFLLAVLWAYSLWRFNAARTWTKRTGVAIKVEADAGWRKWQVKLRYRIGDQTFEEPPAFGQGFGAAAGTGETVPILVHPDNPRLVLFDNMAPGAFIAVPVVVTVALLAIFAEAIKAIFAT